jgi:hypothetical protein
MNHAKQYPIGKPTHTRTKNGNCTDTKESAIKGRREPKTQTKYRKTTEIRTDSNAANGFLKVRFFCQNSKQQFNPYKLVRKQ